MTIVTNWQCTRLSNVADVTFSNVDKHTLDDEAPVRLCNYVDVYKNDRITSAIEFMEASADAREIGRFQIQCNDVLVTKDSESPDDIAIPALVSEELPGVLCGYHLAMIRPRSARILGPYLFWLHSSKQFRSHYEANAVGVTRFGLSQHQFKSVSIPLPPLPEQERIATYLDASCTAIDAAVAAKQQQINILVELQRVVIAKAVSRGLNDAISLKDSGVLELGPIPSHWRRTKLRYELTVRSGDFASDKLKDGAEFPVIGGNGEMGRTSSYNVNGKLVVVGRVGAYCGNVHYICGRAWVSDNALIIESSHHMRFITHLLRVLDFNSTAKKTAQPLVTGTQIKNTYVAMPPVPEQVKIVEFIEEQASRFDALHRSLLRQIDTLTAYRKSLIHECVTGQRRISGDDLLRLATQPPDDNLPVAH